MKQVSGSSDRCVSAQKFDGGFTLLEMLVSMAMSTVVLAGIVGLYQTISKASYDQKVRISANLEAQAVLQTIASDFRSLGNGVPFDQANFQIDENTLTDPTVTYPLYPSTASESRLQFRLNETGVVHLLTAEFNPMLGLQVVLTDVDEILIGDDIYISNSVISGDDGFYAKVADVNESTKTLTLTPGTFVYSPASTFGVGSILEVVPVVDLKIVDGVITRDAGRQAVELAREASMSFTYLDFDGNELTLPLTNAKVINQLRSVEVTVSVKGSRSLRDGTEYEAFATQVLALRNLNHVF